MLARVRPIFQTGLGGRLGGGRQWMSWISLTDEVGALYHCLLEERMSGPVNFVSPGAVTNRTFTRMLARVLRRPTLLPVPAIALRMALGEMADELLLASAKVRPAALAAGEYRFRHSELGEALRYELGLERADERQE